MLLKKLLMRLRNSWPKRRDVSTVYVHDRVSEYKEIWQAVAAEIGAQFAPLAEDLWEIRRNNKGTRILNYKMEFDDPVILEMAGRKALVYRILSEKGLRVPEHDVFELNSLARAEAFLKQHPEGCAVKPAKGTASGLGITTHVKTSRELRNAAILASFYDPELLIEQMIPGESYRLLVLDSEVIHAVRRKGPRVMGDGKSTVAQLAKAAGASLSHLDATTLASNRDCQFTLGYQGLSSNSVPPAGKVVVVQSVGDPRHRHTEVRTIYDEVVTDLLCKEIKQNASSVAASMGSRLLGVDIITTNPETPLEESGGAIIEANTTPGLHHHYDKRIERFPQPALRVIDALLR